MTLIPASQLDEAKARLEQRAGLETAKVERQPLFREIRTVGTLDYNEPYVRDIAARIAGRIDRLYADFTGIEVKEGDHLVDIYSPELVVAQEELLRALKMAQESQGTATTRQFTATNVESSRNKLLLLGITPEQVAQIEQSRKPSTHLTIYAPLGGIVIEKAVRLGQYVDEGDLLYRIADLDPMWLYLDIYEHDAAWVRYGQHVEVTLEAFPGETFHGMVTFIDPYLDDQTRTINVRVNLPNPDRRLKPAMYASALIHVRLRADGSPAPTGLEGKFICPMHPDVVRDVAGKCPICGMQLTIVPPSPPLDAAKAGAPKNDATAVGAKGFDPTQVLAIPATAVLDTGRRRVVYRKTPRGAYELVEVQVGPRSYAENDEQRVPYVPVFAGLKAGDEVVASGGFLLDSQRQIEGMPSLLYPEGQSGVNLHAGHGGAAPAPKPDGAPPAAKPGGAGHQH